MCSLVALPSIRSLEIVLYFLVRSKSSSKADYFTFSPTSERSPSMVKLAQQIQQTLIFLIACASLISIAAYYHYQLPRVHESPFNTDGVAVFSETAAMKYITDLASYPDGSSRCP
jgi:hypothetical protein